MDCFRISIPSGTIKSVFHPPNIGLKTISIPSGTIKRAIGDPDFAERVKISIPSGTIKSSTKGKTLTL